MKYKDLFSIRKEPHIYMSDVGQGLMMNTYYFDPNLSFDLANLNGYDTDLQTVLVEANDKHYYYEFLNKIARTDFLKIQDLLEYHFSKTQAEQDYLNVLEYEITQSYFKGEKSKKNLIVQWVNNKRIDLNKSYLLQTTTPKVPKPKTLPSVLKEMTENEKAVINSYKFLKKAEKLSKRMAVLKVHKEKSVPESTIYRYLKKYNID